MKKFAVLALAGLLVIMFTMPAAALENVFGGYWRTRFYTNQHFTGNDKDQLETKPDGTHTHDQNGVVVLGSKTKIKRNSGLTRMDTRARLYYTAILNDNLKFVSKFEMDATFGDQSGYGDIGADGVDLEIKNSYVDFSLGAVNAKVGVQGGSLARGFIFDDDFSGAVVSFGSGGVNIPLMWVKAFDEDSTANKRDVDYFVVSPSFSAGAVNINPFGMYVFSDNASTWGKTAAFNDVDIYYAGANIDVNLGAVSLWGTGIYQGGEVELNGTDTKQDIKAWLGAGGLTLGLGGAADLHGQFVYASGDDGKGSDIENFFVPKGQSYYWSEIMGLGTFDGQSSNNSPEDKISNIMIANLGTTIKPTADLKISLDAWWAQFVEDIDVNGSMENDLGIEANVKITYTLVQGLNLDLVGAYLFAGDATYKGDDGEDPFEIGTRLSLSF